MSHCLTIREFRGNLARRKRKVNKELNQALPDSVDLKTHRNKKTVCNDISLHIPSRTASLNYYLHLLFQSQENFKIMLTPGKLGHTCKPSMSRLTGRRSTQSNMFYTSLCPSSTNRYFKLLGLLLIYIWECGRR